MEEYNYSPRGSVSYPAIALVATYLLAVAALAAITLVAAWPDPAGPLIQTRLGSLSIELRYLLVIACSAALGGSVHSLTSFTDHLGNRTLVRGWLLFYFVHVFVAVPLALIFYFALRGMLFSPTAQISDLNAYGLAAISGLVGLFSRPAMDKLSDVFLGLFGQPTKLETQVARIGTTLGLATLDNYDGYICTFFQDASGGAVEMLPDGRPKLYSGGKYELIIWFQPKPLPQEEGKSEKVKVEGDGNAPLVEFSLNVDSEKIKFRTHRSIILAPEAKRSENIKFSFEAPPESDSIEFWIIINQKTKYVDQISQFIKVEDRSIPSLHL